ncbi:MAG: LacI family DNA-binding transcriptional regulator [Rhodobacteraceae bacterium]|nr:LacI family DNA-binding transcriptional regulator [Paracoccaceae bacterium]
MTDDPLKRRVTSFDVARLAGVSRSAVSRAFSKDAVISDATRQKVLEAASSLGYRVNFMARSLQTRHSNLVGIVASALDSPFRSRQVKIAAREFLQRGFRPILMTAETEDEVEKLSEILFNYNVAGILITSATPPSTIIAECSRLSIPIVLVNRGLEMDDVDTIQIDIEQSGRLAFEMLTSSGARRLAALQPIAPSYSVTGRAKYFIQTCEQENIPVQQFFTDGQDFAAGRRAAHTIAESVLAGDAGLDGLFCATDTLAFGVLDTLRHDYGIAVPGQLQIVGFDDVEQASWGSYQLSTIRQDAEKQSVAAVEMMLNRIKNPNLKARNIIHSVTPVYRKTTRTSHGV